MREIKYEVRPIVRDDADIRYGAFENGALLDTFDSEASAWRYIEIWKRVMR